MTTDSEVTEIRSCHNHDHSSDDVMVSVAKARTNMNELAKTSKSAPTQIISQIRQNIYLTMCVLISADWTAVNVVLECK